MKLSNTTVSNAIKACDRGHRNPLIGTVKNGPRAGQPCGVRYSDGRNLFLNVNVNGAMSWVFKWKVGRKVTEIGLGSATGTHAPTRLTLAEARLSADKVRGQLAAGIDPLADRKRARLSAAATFQHLLDQFLAKVPALKGWKCGTDGRFRYEQTWRNGFRDHAPKLLAMPVDAIDTAAVSSVLMPIWGRKVAEDVRSRIEQVLDFAKGVGHRRGMDNAAAWKGNLQAMLIAKPTKRTSRADSHAALHYDAVPAFMRDLAAFEGNGAKALCFAVLTATRTNETRLARWPEIDLDKALWTIPAARMKAGVEHIVPLSAQAVALLRSLVRAAGNDYVFTGASGVIGESALLDKLAKDARRGGMGLKGMTVHGFRSSFSDWVGDETTFAREDREFCLAHGIEKVEAAYRRSTAVKKRREIMQAWADYCEGKVNVVALREVA